MTGLKVDAARCEALFASGLQRSDAPDAEAVAAAIRATLRQFGTRGCAGRMAQEFGDHPEEAARRMRWVRQIVAGTPPRRSDGYPAGAVSGSVSGAAASPGAASRAGGSRCRTAGVIRW